MMKKTLTTLLTICLLAIVLLPTTSQAQKGGGRMFGEPIGRLWMANNDAMSDPPPDGSYFIQFYAGMGFLQDPAGNTLEMAFFTPDGARPPQAGSAMMLDSDGNLCSVPAGATNQSFLDIGTDPASLQWPQESATFYEGRVLGINTVGTPSTLAPLTVPVQVAVVTGVNLNTGTKTNLFTPGTGQEWIVDYYIIRDASTSLTTVEASAGSNAGANDWHDNRRFTFLTTATRFLTITPKIGTDTGGEITTDSTPFGIICNVLQGAAATATIEVYAHRVG